MAPTCVYPNGENGRLGERWSIGTEGRHLAVVLEVSSHALAEESYTTQLRYVFYRAIRIIDD